MPATGTYERLSPSHGSPASSMPTPTTSGIASRAGPSICSATTPSAAPSRIAATVRTAADTEWTTAEYMVATAPNGA